MRYYNLIHAKDFYQHPEFLPLSLLSLLLQHPKPFAFTILKNSHPVADLPRPFHPELTPQASGVPGAFRSPCLTQPESHCGQETAPSFSGQVLAWLPQVPLMFVLSIPNKSVFYDV